MRALLSLPVALLAAASLPAQSGTLDQQSPFGNAWFNGDAVTLVWQQQVRVGVAGQLEGFELEISSANPGATIDLEIRVGPGWNTGAAAWTGTATTTIGGSVWERAFFDTTSANLQFAVGDVFVLQMQGTATGGGIRGDYQAPPNQPPYPEDLFLNGPGCYADCGWRLGFNTWMLSGSNLRLSKTGVCPGPVTLSVVGATPGGRVALLYGQAGSTTSNGPNCPGTTVDIASPPAVGAILTADGGGSAALSFSAPSGACGLTVQAVDLPSCVASNSLVL